MGDWSRRVQAAQQSIAEMKDKCLHPETTTRSFRCPQCRGILRRCCDSVLGSPHQSTCPEAK